MATLCLVAAASGSVQAQRAISQYLRDEWNGERGFPGGAVHAVTQTNDGYLWIGSEKGLVRFDGLSFRLLEPKGMPNTAPAVLGVVPGPDGSLWARLRGIAWRCLRVWFHDFLPSFAGEVSAQRTEGS